MITGYIAVALVRINVSDTGVKTRRFACDDCGLRFTR